MSVLEISFVQILCNDSKEISNVISVMEDNMFICKGCGECVNMDIHHFRYLIRRGGPAQLFIENQQEYVWCDHNSIYNLFNPIRYKPISYSEFMRMASENDNTDCDMSVLGV